MNKWRVLPWVVLDLYPYTDIDMQTQTLVGQKASQDAMGRLYPSNEPPR